MSNKIPRRIYDFLKVYPPFDLMGQDDLLRLANQVVVQYYEPDETIFAQGSPTQPYIYVVKDGAVQLFRQQAEEDLLVDYCDEGDLFGLRPLIAEEIYTLTAITKEETLIYAIPVKPLTAVLEKTPQASWFLAQSFAAGVRNITAQQQEKGRLFIGQQKYTEALTNPLNDIQWMESEKAPVTCSPDTNIRTAATIMTEKRVSSIIVVDEDSHPLGIVTDKDIRYMVARGEDGFISKVSAIMSSPVKTVPKLLTVADAQIEMLKHGIHHLVLTEDGTADSPVCGVISQHDMLVLQGNNPASFIREIQQSNTTLQLSNIRQKAEHLLRTYIYQEVSISFISTVMTAVNDALIKKCIDLAIERVSLPKPAASFCFLALGSQGRGEQLLRTDQDNAIVFEDVEEEAYKSTKSYYVELGETINQLLQECGFAFCPADMMAGNPDWCLSLSEWKKQFSDWIFLPKAKNILYSTIFFDYRPIYGKKKLAEFLTEHIFENLDKQTIFLSYLAKYAVENPPPLSFFRNFVVEKSGDHKDEFDIKKRAMMPLCDAARALILNARIPDVNNTIKRFEKMAELEPQNSELFIQAADAYEILVRYRALQGLKNKNTGRYFAPSTLTKMERLNMRNSFRAIRGIQNLLTIRFQLGFLR